MVESAQNNESASPSPEEIAQVVSDLEQYRERLVEDFMTTAKKAKLPKSMVTAQLKAHPEIARIDASLAKLRGESPAEEQSAEEQPASH